MLKMLFFFTLLALTLLFAYQNIDSVSVSFLKYRVEIPLFLALLVSFVLGFVLSYVAVGFTTMGAKNYARRMKRALLSLWLGQNSDAEKEFSKLLNYEETVPLFGEALRALGKSPQVYLQKYGLGIAETYMAGEILKKDRRRAKDLLEKALGKNWDNLSARRMLRSVYFLEGEFEKAIDLQRNILKDTDKKLREVEKRILASILARGKGDEALGELEKLPPTPASLSLLSVSGEPKGRKKYILRAFEEGLQNEVVLILTEENRVVPELVEVVEEKSSHLSPTVLALLYGSVGMHTKLEKLTPSLPPEVRAVYEKKDLCKELVSLLKLWECGVCGKEYSSYSPLCENCLSWDKLRVKGG